MAQKRLLYFTSAQVASYRWRSGRLDVDAVFQNDEEGISAFNEKRDVNYEKVRKK